MEKNVHGAGFCTVVLSVRTYTLSPSFSLSRRWHWHTQERRALSLVCSASRPVVGFLSCRSAAAILSFSFSLLLYHCTHTHTQIHTEYSVYARRLFPCLARNPLIRPNQIIWPREPAAAAAKPENRQVQVSMSHLPRDHARENVARAPRYLYSIHCVSVSLSRGARASCCASCHS